MIGIFSRTQQKLYRLLGENHDVWVTYLDVQKFQDIEFRYGYQVCKRILGLMENELEKILKEQRNLFQLSMLEPRGGDDFVIYFVPSQNTPWDIAEISRSWVQSVEDRINSRINKLINEKIHLRTGIVLCTNNPQRNPDYLLYATAKEAFLLNKSEQDPNYFIRRNEFDRILNKPEDYLKAAFQPIVSVKTQEIFGHEALSRIMGETAFSNISVLFPFAEKINQLYPIETLCRREAIKSSSKVLIQKEHLLLNINPQVLNDPDFASGQTRKLLLEQGLTPSKVILEITERSAIENFSAFRTALEHYRAQGFLIALDDVGAGYSSLQSIAELHPDFLKIDRSLISGVNANPTKWALLETFVTFSKRIGCRVVAEGIETEQELSTVVKLGVDYVQGYFLARPNFERTLINPVVFDIIRSQRHNNVTKESSKIQPLVEPLPLFGPETPGHAIKEFFQLNPQQNIIGVISNNTVVGIVQREKFFTALGSTYGVPLYLGRPVSLIMDKNPLVVENSTPIEVVSSLAMERSQNRQYDGVVVVSQKKPIGMVSVARMMKAISEKQIQIARGANPLTGLPGNNRIDHEIRDKVLTGEVFGIIYADLNQFKYYNDIYGFYQGDLAIKLFAEVLVNAASSFDKNAFVGHIGGDDFIVILNNYHLETFCQSTIETFNKSTQNFVGVEELTISLAALTITNKERVSSLLIAQKAAQLKNEVKKIGGNAYLIS